MDFTTVLVVGAITGLLASLFMGGGALFGIGRNILNGVVGAFCASWLFGGLNLRAPMEGSGGPILVALSGAIGLLLLQRGWHHARRGWDRWTRSSSRSRAWRSVPRAR